MNNNKHTQVVDFSNPNADKIISGSTQAQMNNNKQNSSVEWFAQESWKLRVELEDDKISIGEYVNKHYQLKEQAKAMEKKQMVNFAEKTVRMVLNEDIQNPVSINQLYNETFGGNNE